MYKIPEKDALVKKLRGTPLPDIPLNNPAYFKTLKRVKHARGKILKSMKKGDSVCEISLSFNSSNGKEPMSQ